MTKKTNFLAFDLGAQSGRAICGSFDGKKFELNDVHRFSNDPVRINGSLYWDVLRLFHEMKEGLLQTVLKYGKDISSMAIDTWGVDFGLLDKKGNLLANPYHYRDSRTDNIMEEAFEIVPKEKMYEKTGLQFLQFNTIFQLLAMKNQQPEMLEMAHSLLFMPDLFNYFFTGKRVTEFTAASTSQCYNPKQGAWDHGLLDELGIDSSILGDISPPGTKTGSILNDISYEANCGDIPFFTVAGHDTGSAVAAVPASGDDHIFLSSGTWSIMGVEINEPLINEQAFKYNFTNEGGVYGTFRFARNIMGLWLIQECRRVWKRKGKTLGYDEIENMARNAKPLVSLINPDHDDFLNPMDMPAAIQGYCKKTGQPVPESMEEIVRCAYDSLALRYRWVSNKLKDLFDKDFKVIHIVGGGTRDKLLSQLTADATGIPVITGPAEATATGNIAVKAITLGVIDSIKEARSVISKSVSLKSYEPSNKAMWDDAFDKFLNLE